MIPLRWRAEASGLEPFVVRLNVDTGARSSARDYVLTDLDGSVATFTGPNDSVKLTEVNPHNLDGDVLFIIPQKRVAHRFIRAESSHNTLVVTEQCDQTCIMCSQPPKIGHVDLFPYFTTAALLAPPNSILGLSGGEPTLYKQQLFQFMSTVTTARPDISFHVLTNGQHFEEADKPALASLRDKVTWGVPLYAASEQLHEEVVGKQGAYRRVLSTLSLFCRAGASVELRTVLLRQNVSELPNLSRLVSVQLPFVTRWAIMQLENIGFARRGWGSQFFDSSADFAALATAIDLAEARGVRALLYNFPLCTVPPAYRPKAPSTISDWKRKYLRECDSCSARDRCGGFFEWYPEQNGFSGVRPL